VRGPTRRPGPLAALLAAALLGGLLGAAGAAGAAGAELRRVEAVGVVPIGGPDGSTGVPRDAAVEAAVQAALLRVARSLLPEDFVPPEGGGSEPLPEPDVWLETELGDDPFVYAVRFSILEDRGPRPAVFAQDPGVDQEYVVVADVQLDVEAIRERLARAGVLDTARPGTARELRIVVEGLERYPPLAALREALLATPGVRSVVPREFTPEAVVLAVNAERGADVLVEDLRRRAPAALHVVPIEAGPDAARLLVDWTAPDAPGGPGAPAAGRRGGD